jgi:hypothetical protein
VCEGSLEDFKCFSLGKLRIFSIYLGTIILSSLCLRTCNHLIMGEFRGVWKKREKKEEEEKREGNMMKEKNKEREREGNIFIYIYMCVCVIKKPCPSRRIRNFKRTLFVPRDHSLPFAHVHLSLILENIIFQWPLWWGSVNPWEACLVLLIS